MSVFMNGYSSSFNGANAPAFGESASDSGPRSAVAGADRIRCAFPGSAAMPAVTPYAPYGGDNGGSGLAGFSNLMSGFIAGLQNMLTSLAQQFGLAGGTNSASSGGGQRFFNTASTSSTGDPHETFDGVAANGTKVNGKWDSMQSHPDLLDSDSFGGGYHVSTIATTPGANGVTMNDSAAIATDNGATTVSMTKDGSYAVSSYGQNVTLQQGQTASLGFGESVTLNADHSLTKTDANAAGGSLSTTLRSNGQGGVDVSSSAKNVDLGGYLVDRNDSNSVPAMPAYLPMQNPYNSIVPAQTEPQWSWQRLTRNANGNGDAALDVAPNEELA